MIVVGSNDLQSLYVANNVCKAVEYFRKMGGNVGVAGMIVNKDDGTGEAKAFAEAVGIPVLCAIPANEDIRRKSANYQIIGTPALVLFLFVVGLFGKMVMLAWIGRRITRHLDGPLASPAFAVLVGGLILLVLYTVPVVGFIVAKLTSWLGIGVVVYTMILGMKRSKAAAAAAAAAAKAAPKPYAVPVAPVAPLGVVPPPAISAAVTTPEAGAPVPPIPPVESVPPLSGAAIPPPVPGPAVIVSAATLPRAGFWIRIAASVLDILIVALAASLIRTVNSAAISISRPSPIARSTIANATASRCIWSVARRKPYASSAKVFRSAPAKAFTPKTATNTAWSASIRLPKAQDGRRGSHGPTTKACSPFTRWWRQREFPLTLRASRATPPPTPRPASG